MSDNTDLELEIDMLDVLRYWTEKRLLHFQGLDGKLVVNKMSLIQHWTRKLDILDCLRSQREMRKIAREEAEKVVTKAFNAFTKALGK